jgi:hypothetical protein
MVHIGPEPLFVMVQHSGTPKWSPGIAPMSGDIHWSEHEPVQSHVTSSSKQIFSITTYSFIRPNAHNALIYLILHPLDQCQSINPPSRF